MAVDIAHSAMLSYRKLRRNGVFLPMVIEAKWALRLPKMPVPWGIPLRNGQRKSFYVSANER